MENNSGEGGCGQRRTANKRTIDVRAAHHLIHLYVVCLCMTMYVTRLQSILCRYIKYQSAKYVRTYIYIVCICWYMYWRTVSGVTLPPYWMRMRSAAASP